MTTLVLKHLTSGSFLHPRKFWCRVTCSFSVDYLGEDPISKHGTFGEYRLFPEIRFVCAHFITGHDTNFISGRIEFDLWGASNDDESVKEM